MENIRRQVVVDHERDLLDIDSAGPDIGGDENTTTIQSVRRDENGTEEQIEGQHTTCHHGILP